MRKIKIDWWIIYGLFIIISSKIMQYYSKSDLWIALFGIYSVLLLVYIFKEYKSNWIKDYINWVKGVNRK